MLLLIQVPAVMSEHVFHSLTGGKAPLAGCDKNGYAYTHPQPLELKGSCMLRVTVPHTKTSAIAEFYVVPGQAANLVKRQRCLQSLRLELMLTTAPQILTVCNL